MPKITQSRGSQVQSQLAPQPRAHTPQGNNAIGEGIASAANTFSVVREEVDTTAAEEGLLSFQKQQTDMFFNRETGYFNTRGITAMQGGQTTRDSLETLRKDIGKGMNDGARKKFDAAANANIMRATPEIMQHASKGQKSWTLSTQKAIQEDSLEGAPMLYDNDKMRKDSLQKGLDAIDEQQAMAGDSFQAINEIKETFRSQHIKGSILGAVDDSSAKAEALLEKIGAPLETKDRDAVMSQIAEKKQLEKVAGDNRYAVSAVDYLMSNFPLKSDMLAEVAKIEDIDRRKLVESRLPARLKLREAYAQDDIAAIAEEATEASVAAENNPDMNSAWGLATWVEKNPRKYGMLPDGMKRTIERGVTPETNWDTHKELTTMTDKQFAEVDLNKHYSGLSPAHFKEFKTAQKKIRSGGDSKTTIQRSIGRTNAKAILDRFNIMMGTQRQSSLSKGQLPVYDAFNNKLQEMIEYEQEGMPEGTSVSPKRFTEILNGMTVSATIVDGGIAYFDKDVTFEDAYEDPRYDEYVSWLRANGFEVNIEGITDAMIDGVLD